MLNRLSNKLWRVIQKRVDALEPPSEDVYFTARSIGDQLRERRNYIHKITDVINSNISTLLTHISAMIAVLSIMLIVFQDTKYTKVFLLIEMMSYTVLAMLCVLGIRWSGFVDGRSEKSLSPLYRIMLTRRYLYQICVDGVIYITMIFFITLFIHILYSMF